MNYKRNNSPDCASETVEDSSLLSNTQLLSDEETQPIVEEGYDWPEDRMIDVQSEQTESAHEITQNEQNDGDFEDNEDFEDENNGGIAVGFDGDESRSEDEEMTAEDRLFLDDDTEMKECSSPGVSHLALLNARRFDDDDQALAR